MILLGGVGIVELDPSLGPTVLASTPSSTGLGLLADGTFAVLTGSLVERVDPANPMPETLFDGSPDGVTTSALVVAPDTVPEPEGAQLAALLALLALAVRRRS